MSKATLRSACVLVVSWFVTSGAGTVGASTIIMGGPAASLTEHSYTWSWEGGSYIEGFREAVENPVYFGPDGVVPVAIETVDLEEISAESLAPLDVFVSSWWYDSDTKASRAGAIMDWFRSGGDLILLQDDSLHDLIGEKLGVPTMIMPSNGSVSNGESVLFEGAFGRAANVGQYGNVGQLDRAAIASLGGTIAATNARGQVTAALWEPGTFSPDSGSLLVVADVDMWSTWRHADYDALNDNARFALNGVAHLVAVPEPPTIALCATGFLIAGAQSCCRPRRRYHEGRG